MPIVRYKGSRVLKEKRNADPTYKYPLRPPPPRVLSWADPLGPTIRTTSVYFRCDLRSRLELRFATGIYRRRRLSTHSFRHASWQVTTAHNNFPSTNQSVTRAQPLKPAFLCRAPAAPPEGRKAVALAGWLASHANASIGCPPPARLSGEVAEDPLTIVPKIACCKNFECVPMASVHFFLEVGMPEE